MHELMQMRLANASSQHAAGRAARSIVEQAREQILKHCGGRTVGMSSDQLLFTSGGTESNNLAIFGLTEDKPGAILVSAIEHPSVLAAAEYLAKQGREVHYLHCNSLGVIELESLQNRLSQHPQRPVALVSIMLANNETGVFQPVAQAAKMCREAGVCIHTDAVQVLGKAPLNFSEQGVDAMSITAHKLHGPIGIGALLLKNGVTPSPRNYGGFQQLGLRPGTETPVLAGGFEVAVAESVSELKERTETMRRLRDELQKRILQTIPESVVVGMDAQRLPHTLSVSFPGVDRQALQLALDMNGVVCSTGSACASGSSQPSHVLEAMKLDKSIVQGAVRFSVSAETTDEEIAIATETLERVVAKLRKS